VIEIAVKTKLFTKGYVYVYACHFLNNYQHMHNKYFYATIMQSYTKDILIHLPAMPLYHRTIASLPIITRFVKNNLMMIRKNIFSILTALVIMYLSLASSHTFDKVPLINIPYFDKIVHLGMYFVLMSVIVFENRKTIITTGQLFMIALIPFFYGILLEILQSALTKTRTGNFYDAVADSCGILLSVLLWLWIKSHKK
jgi:VanZ family protein